MEVSIIIPTLNEEKNVFKLHKNIKDNFKCNKYEIIYVDDSSDDNTQQKIIFLSKKEKNIKYIFRKERNLSTAFLDGVKISKGYFILLMDADLQHMPVDINKLLYKIKNNNLDIVIGSRFLKNSKNYLGSFKSRIRLFLSRFFIFVINKTFGLHVSDPLAGFFMAKKRILINNEKLYKKGFKILLDYLVTNKNKFKIDEVPIKINKRFSGKSKLNLKIFILFVKQFYFYLTK